jgi:hypothetical protein
MMFFSKQSCHMVMLGFYLANYFFFLVLLRQNMHRYYKNKPANYLTTKAEGRTGSLLYPGLPRKEVVEFSTT